MSVQTEIDRIITAVHAAHEKVKEKGGTTSEPYLVANLEGAIGSIPEASDPTLQSKTVSPATSQQVVTPDSGYDGLSSVTVNAMPTATQATPSISVSSAGKITATATQTAGYVSAGTKSATKQLTTQAAKTVTPSTSNQTAVASGVYTTGAVSVAGDANLVAGNIKSGVSIFGVSGSYEGSGGGGSETEMQTVTGSIVPSDTDWGTTVGTEVFSVSGLHFTPKILVIYPTSTMETTLKKTALFCGYTYIKDVQDKMAVMTLGTITSASGVDVKYQDNGEPFFKLTVNSDGFTLTTSGASAYTRRTRGNYTYIAMA